MKKLIALLSILVMSLVSLTGCNEIHKGNLETIEVTNYVKEEETSKLSGAMVFYCVFGSYTHATTHKVIQRYIFLAQNGPRNSYKINDVHVYSNLADEPKELSYTPSYVYFIYTEEGEEPYLEYQYKEAPDDAYNYWLHLPRSKILEIANDMFKDL